MGADLSLAASSYHSLTGPDLLSEHLREVRTLRHRLEDSIQTNERLRLQLEDRLDRKHSETHQNRLEQTPTNIYIQGVESVEQLSTEIRVLTESNTSLQTKLRESSSEVVRLREALLLVQTRLKEAGLQVQKWAELSKNCQSEASTQRREVNQLRQEKHRNLDLINRLNHEVSVLQQRLVSLQRNSSVDLSEEQSLRRHLQFNDCCGLIRDEGSAFSDEEDTNRTEGKGSSLVQSGLKPDTDLVLVSVQDFLSLQQHILLSLCLLKTITDTGLKTRTDPDQDRTLWDCERLRQVLKEAHVLSCRGRPTEQNHLKQVERLKEEVSCLRLKLSGRDQTLKTTLESLQSSNKTKDAMELFILSHLSRTRDVLRKAKTNLQVKRGGVPLAAS